MQDVDISVGFDAVDLHRPVRDEEGSVSTAGLDWARGQRAIRRRQVVVDSAAADAVDEREWLRLGGAAECSGSHRLLVLEVERERRAPSASGSGRLDGASRPRRRLTRAASRFSRRARAPSGAEVFSRDEGPAVDALPAVAVGSAQLGRALTSAWPVPSLLAELVPWACAATGAASASRAHNNVTLVGRITALWVRHTVPSASLCTPTDARKSTSQKGPELGRRPAVPVS